MFKVLLATIKKSVSAPYKVNGWVIEWREVKGIFKIANSNKKVKICLISNLKFIKALKLNIKGGR